MEKKYIKIEWFVLLFICLIVTLISDLEYSIIEEKNVWNFAKDLNYRLVTGAFSLLFFSILYFLFLRPFVIRKKYVATLLTIIISLFVYRLYGKFVVDGTVAMLPFIDKEIRGRAWKDFSSSTIYFQVSYFLSRYILTLLGLAMFVRAVKQDEELKLLKEQQLLSELNYLKAQIHPHFFFNTINNIYSLALKQSSKTAEMIAKLGEMMRYILYEASQESVPMKGEIKFLSDYIEVERMRHPETIAINFDVQGIDMEYAIGPLLMLPFVENAFKHGIENETGKGYVDIVICQTPQELMLQVVNSIPSVLPAGSVPGGFGLDNVMQRLNILYPDKFELVCNQSANRYDIHLTIRTT